MNARVVVAEHDGTFMNVGLQFENGLILRAEGHLPFAGRQRRQELREQVKQVLQSLKSAGFEVDFGRIEELG